MTLKSAETRFRAYQLDTPGASYSHFDGSNFTLIEARLTETNKVTLENELKACNKQVIDTLHITSWDQDHCTPSQLNQILDLYAPKKIECPGYTPHTTSGEESLEIITAYKAKSKFTQPKLVRVTPEYISSLNTAENFGYKDIIYHPRRIQPDNSNNNSIVKQFRTGSFNVLSLGDVECANISAWLRRIRSIHSEVDIMLLAHHGANNGFTSSAFLKAVAPSFAIVGADYGNMFEHPKQEIVNLLRRHDIPLATTKKGDVIVRSIKGHKGHYEVINLEARSTAILSRAEGFAKKTKHLSMNADSIRNLFAKKPYRG